MRAYTNLLQHAIRAGLIATGISAITISLIDKAFHIDSVFLITLFIAVTIGDFTLSVWNKFRSHATNTKPD